MGCASRSELDRINRIWTIHGIQDWVEQGSRSVARVPVRRTRAVASWWQRLGEMGFDFGGQRWPNKVPGASPIDVTVAAEEEGRRKKEEAGALA
jgi:hypothetical protein